MEHSSVVFRMKIYFNLNSQGNDKIEFFSQKTYKFQILGNETIIDADYKDIKVSIFSLFGHMIFIQIHSFKSANFPQNSVSFLRAIILKPTNQMQISLHRCDQSSRKS